MFTWAKVLYADKEAAQFFDGIGVHWYVRTLTLTRTRTRTRTLTLTLT